MKTKLIRMVEELVSDLVKCLINVSFIILNSSVYLYLQKLQVDEPSQQVVTEYL